MCLEVLARLISPLLPHLAEEVWHALPYKEHPPYSSKRSSVFELSEIWDIQKRKLAPFPPFAEGTWSLVRSLRNDINKALEVGRKAKIIGSSLDASIFLTVEKAELSPILTRLCNPKPFKPHSSKSDCQLEMEDSRFLFLVSEICILDSPSDVARAVQTPNLVLSGDETESGSTIGVRASDTPKCARCWFHDTTVGNECDHPLLCARCYATVQNRPQFVHSRLPD